MKVKCVCGNWHDISPTGLAIVIAAFQDGDLIHVNTTSTHTECLVNAFRDTTRVREFKRRYKGNVVSIDSERL